MAVEISDKEFLLSAENVSIVKIKPGGGWLAISLSELWAYRELLYFLAWRDVKVRYKQTLLGVLWVLLQPVLTTVIFSILFARFAPSQSSEIPYPLFAFTGFILWTFASNALNNAGNSLVSSSNLVTKVYFPRLIMPLAAIAATMVDLLISLGVLVLALLFFGANFSWTIIFAPFFAALLILFVFGLGTLLAALNVRFRDVRFILPFALQILMFASPVFYSLDFLPERWHIVWKLNPLTGILQGFRAAVFGTEFDVTAIAISVAVTVVLILLTVSVFTRMEENFADLV
jgi:lipopolysaccharide transport system permease protein